MAASIKPIVYVSKCLGFDNCRYNGLIISSDFIRLLRGHVNFALVCPEVEIGLGVPRYPIRVVQHGSGNLRLLQAETEADVTERMIDYTEKLAARISDVDGFILKSRSPSCGIYGVKVYPSLGKVGAQGKTVGFFGGGIKKRFPALPIEDEGRLNNFRIREHFLTAIFTLVRFRQVRAAGRMRELVGFQSQHKYLLMAYSQSELKKLGRIVANHERQPLEKVLTDYENRLHAALARPPRYKAQINTLEHVSGHFSKLLGSEEKWFLRDAIEKFRLEQVPMSVPLFLLRSYAVRFEDEYVDNQAFFEPYPKELISITDSGKGRASARD